METINIILMVVIGLIFALIIWVAVVAILKSKNKNRTTRSSHNLPNIAGTWGSIKPYLSGTFGVCVLVILFGTACLLYAVPGSAGYLWWVTPILIAMVFLIVKVSNTVKNEFARGVVYVVIVIAAGTVILPRLPGSTPAQPIQYTPGQMAELQEMRQACSGGKQAYTYLPTYQPVNPNGWCVTTFWHHGHCIYVRDAMRTEHGPYCDYQGGTQIRLPLDIREVRSSESQFVGYLERKPDYKALSFYYTP